MPITITYDKAKKEAYEKHSMERTSKREDRIPPAHKLMTPKDYEPMEMMKVIPSPSKMEPLPANLGTKAGNTSYLVVPAKAPDGSLDPIQDTKDGINAPVPMSTLQEIAGTNTSQVQSTPVTAYRGSAKF